MKYSNKVLMYCLTFLHIFALSCISFADERVNSVELVDVVYEWSPGSTSIQIGDYTINNFASVWVDNGYESMTQVSSNRIKTGDLVKVYLINKDSDGFWRADKIIIFAGEALTDEIENLPEIKREEIKRNELRSTKSSSSPRAPRQTQTPVLIDGVWVN